MLPDLAARGFSCPQEELDVELFGALASLFSQGAVQVFLENARPRLETAGRGVVELLDRWSQGEPSLRECWSPYFGESIHAIGAANPGATDEVAVSLLMHLHASGVEGEWEFSVNDPVSPRANGWLLPPARRFRVSANGVETSIYADDQRYLFRTNNSAWTSSSAAVPLDVIGQRESIFLLPTAALLANEIGELRGEIVEEVTPDDVNRVRAGLSLVEEHGGPYLNWVEFVLREIALLHEEGRMVHSGGVGSHFGQIHMTSCGSRTLTAEMLVHEASHQYFELLRRVDPLDDSGEAEEHYSPPIRRNRPLWALLKAYHAFANVLLLHASLQRAGVPSTEFDIVNLDQVREDVRQLQETLSRFARFTSVGQQVFDPLVERLGGL